MSSYISDIWYQGWRVGAARRPLATYFRGITESWEGVPVGSNVLENATTKVVSCVLDKTLVLY